MRAKQVETNASVRHPRETTALFGHHEAETALLNAFRSGRIPHAWLIGGAQGIGKATLAYRMARFVLGFGSGVRVMAPESLAKRVRESAAAALHAYGVGAEAGG